MDFNDFEPQLIPKQIMDEQGCEVRPLVNDPLFKVDACSVEGGQRLSMRERRLIILGLVAGQAVGGKKARPIYFVGRKHGA